MKFLLPTIVLTAAALLSACGKSYYSIGTKNDQVKDYVIYQVLDSSVISVPIEYRHELTPEVIGAYGKKFIYRDLTEFHKIPGSGSQAASIGFGIAAGAIAGSAAGYAAYRVFDTRSWFPALYLAGGAIVGAISGGFIGNSSRPQEEDLLPHIRLQKE